MVDGKNLDELIEELWRRKRSGEALSTMGEIADRLGENAKRLRLLARTRKVPAILVGERWKSDLDLVCAWWQATQDAPAKGKPKIGSPSKRREAVVVALQEFGQMLNLRRE
jgi:hypothetical protein